MFVYWVKDFAGWRISYQSSVFRHQQKTCFDLADDRQLTTEDKIWINYLKHYFQ
jgi:hypothetical protein